MSKKTTKTTKVSTAKKDAPKKDTTNSRLSEREMCKARHCANCHWHWKPRGYHKDWNKVVEPSFCMLDIPQEEIDYVVKEIENKTGYDPERYTRKLIQIMNLNEEDPQMIDWDNPRWLRGEEKTKCCQFYRRSKGCIYRTSLP